VASAIALEGVTKAFGPDRGVFDVGFTVEPGEIFGFLGPNGAGKTTLIRILLDYLRPQAGRAAILGHDCQREPAAVRRAIGYVPAEFRLDEQGTARGLLRYLAGFRPPGALKRAETLAERLELPLDRKIKVFSKGMKQKVALIQAFMHDPALLILDEPTEGLDPLMQHALHELLREAARAGRTVFFSSHALAEVDQLCDRVAVIGKGKLLALETVQALRARRMRILRLRFTEAIAPPALPDATLVQHDATGATYHVGGAAPALLPALSALPLADFTLEAAPLEDAFLEFYA
jgi:ABC-2 type transport system ATP-binding protein